MGQRVLCVFARRLRALRDAGRRGVTGVFKSLALSAFELAFDIVAAFRVLADAQCGIDLGAFAARGGVSVALERAKNRASRRKAEILEAQMSEKWLRYPELKGLLAGFLLVFITDWLLFPSRMAWIDFSWPSQDFRFLTALMKALAFGAPLGWNSWSAWREYRETRWAAAKTRLRFAGWSLLLVQCGLVASLAALKKADFSVNSRNLAASEIPQFLLICAFNFPLMWALLLTLVSAFMPAKDKHKVQITEELRL